jgi:hypothetical protein
MQDILAEPRTSSPFTHTKCDLKILKVTKEAKFLVHEDNHVKNEERVTRERNLLGLSAHVTKHRPMHHPKIPILEASDFNSDQTKVGA